MKHPFPPFKTLTAVAALFLASACSGTKSTAVTELTQYDKHMSCTELQMEITEASFLREQAERNRGLNIRNVVMPLSYPSTYMSASNAVEATSNRIEYLSRLHEIKGCNIQQQYASAETAYGYGGGFEPVAYAEPRMQPMPQQGYAQHYAPPPQHVHMQPPPRGYVTQPHYARPAYGY